MKLNIDAPRKSENKPPTLAMNKDFVYNGIRYVARYESDENAIRN